MALLTRKRKKNVRLERFVLLCANGVTPAEAAKEVGFKESTGRFYASTHSAEIHKLAMDRLRRLTPGAVATIAKLCGESRSAAVQLAAANRILDAAGEGVVHKQEVIHRTDADLVQALLDAVGGDKTAARGVLQTMGIPIPAALQPEVLH
jgi:hypothetical protein